MSIAGRRATVDAEPAVDLLKTPRRPAWVDRLLAAVDATVSRSHSGTEVETGGGFVFARWRAPAVRQLDGAGFRGAVEEAYRELLLELLERGVVPLRFWNYIPGINEVISGEHDRYELFNMARAAAISQCWGDDERTELPAASAVGSLVEELVIEVLASSTPPRALENPRQTPAYRYSERYGPVPPIFSRAVLLGTPVRLDGLEISALLSGTASIVGEDTLHPGNLEAQLAEIVANLEAIAESSRRELQGVGSRPEGAAASEKRALGCFRDVRIYTPAEDGFDTLIAWFRERFGHLSCLELMRVDLCRRNLKVEVEGTLCFPDRL